MMRRHSRQSRRYQRVREVFTDFDMTMLTDDELEAVVRVFDARMGIAYASRNTCNKEHQNAAKGRFDFSQ